MQSITKAVYDLSFRKNPFVAKNFIPLGTKRPIYEYDLSTGIPEKDIVGIPMQPSNMPFIERKVFNLLSISEPGTKKTQDIKLISWFMQQMMFDLLMFDLKSSDIQRAELPNPYAKNLPPYTKADGIKLKAYYPSFIDNEDELGLTNEERKHFNVYSIDVTQLNRYDFLLGMGLSYKAADYILGKIKQGATDVRKILDEVEFERGKTIHKDTVTSIESSLYSFINNNTFSDKHKKIDFNKEWQDENAIVISYEACDEQYMSFDIGLNGFEAYRVRRKNNYTKPLFVAIDDSFFCMENISEKRGNLALKFIKNILYGWRSKGILSMVVTHKVDLMPKKYIEAFNWKIISPLSNPDALSKIDIPRSCVDYVRAGLYENDKNHIIEKVLVNKKKWQPYYTFDCPPNHFKVHYR